MDLSKLYAVIADDMLLVPMVDKYIIRMLENHRHGI